MSQMNFIIYIWDHLVILLRFYLTDAVFLLAMTGIWNLIFPTLKQAGHIQALYRLLLLTEAAAFLFLGAGLISCFLPASLFGTTEYFRGQYQLYGNFYLGISALVILVCCLNFYSAMKKFVHDVKKDRQLRTLCYPTGDRKRLAAYHDLGAQLGLRKLPDLFENPGYSSPFIIGIFHPLIVVTFDVFTSREQYISMSHELVHFKRNDVFFRGMDRILRVFFWFLPWAEKQHERFTLIQEVLCDEYVREAFKDEGFAASYYVDISNMTNRKASIVESKKKILQGANLSESPAQLVDRLETSLHIQYGRKKFPLVFVLCLLCVGGIAALEYQGISPSDLLAWHDPFFKEVTEASMEQAETDPDKEVFRLNSSMSGSGEPGTASDADQNKENTGVTKENSDGQNPEQQSSGQQSSGGQNPEQQNSEDVQETEQKLLKPGEPLETNLDPACCISTDPISAEEIKSFRLEILADNMECQIRLRSDSGEQCFQASGDFYEKLFDLDENYAPYELIIENNSEKSQHLGIYLEEK